jgi:hypothetical protein
MSLQDLLPAFLPVILEFDRFGIQYYIGGSVASSYYGEPRSTLDIDIGADLSESDIGELISKWDSDFYVSESAVRDAVSRGKCFNFIHLSTALKVDVFVCGTDKFNVFVLKRRISRNVATDKGTLSVWRHRLKMSFCTNWFGIDKAARYLNANRAISGQC